MKIVTYVLAVLLVAALGAGAFFYFSMWQPVMADYTRMKAGLPELDKAKAELRKYKEREAKETAWISPAVETLNAGLSDEIKAGTAEVAVAGTGIVVNLAEKILYTPNSMTFAKDSPQLRQKLATLLGSKELKGKEITVANTTDSVPAKGKGKKKILPKEGRVLAADRSVALTKFLEQNKVDQDALIAAAYASKLPDTGFKIKDHKTVILIDTAPAPREQPKAAPPAKKAETAAPSGDHPVAPKPIPIKPAEPKGQ